MNNLGKIRVYRCECGGICARPLHGEPKPCERCDAKFADTFYTIEDQRVFLEDLYGKQLSQAFIVARKQSEERANKIINEGIRSLISLVIAVSFIVAITCIAEFIIKHYSKPQTRSDKKVIGTVLWKHWTPAHSVPAAFEITNHDGTKTVLKKYGYISDTFEICAHYENREVTALCSLELYESVTAGDKIIVVDRLSGGFSFEPVEKLETVTKPTVISASKWNVENTDHGVFESFYKEHIKNCTHCTDPKEKTFCPEAYEEYKKWFRIYYRSAEEF